MFSTITRVCDDDGPVPLHCPMLEKSLWGPPLTELSCSHFLLPGP